MYLISRVFLPGLFLNFLAAHGSDKINLICQKFHYFFLVFITCSSSVDESCRLEPADSDERNLGGGFGGTLPEKHSDMCI